MCWGKPTLCNLGHMYKNCRHADGLHPFVQEVTGPYLKAVTVALCPAPQVGLQKSCKPFFSHRLHDRCSHVNGARMCNRSTVNSPHQPVSQKRGTGFSVRAWL